MKIKQKVISFALMIAAATGVAGIAAQPTLAACGGAETSIINCNANAEPSSAKDSAIWQVLLIALNILTAGVGIAAVGGIVYGSIMYTTASDNAQQTEKAIEIIRNVVLGLVAYGLMYLVLNFLIPGGVFA